MCEGVTLQGFKIGPWGHSWDPEATEATEWCYTYTGGPLYPRIQYPRLAAARKEFGKLQK